MNELPESRYDESGRPIKKRKHIQNKTNSKNNVYLILGIISITIIVIILNFTPNIEKDLDFFIPFVIGIALFIKVYFLFNPIKIKPAKFEDDFDEEFDEKYKTETSSDKYNYSEEESDYDEKKADRIIKEANK
jgi:hypothetical protein